MVLLAVRFVRCVAARAAALLMFYALGRGPRYNCNSQGPSLHFGNMLNDFLAYVGLSWVPFAESLGKAP